MVDVRAAAIIVKRRRRWAADDRPPPTRALVDIDDDVSALAFDCGLLGHQAQVEVE
jgi:hypothetical protein